MQKIIYVMDPHCGWCYGNSANLSAIYKKFEEKFDFEIIVGGMWLSENAPNGGENLSNYLEQNIPRLEDTTGVTIGKPFYELMKNENYILSSLEPCAAIKLIKKMAPKKAIDFAKRVQEITFIDGKALDSIDSYIPILQELNISKETFEKEWLSENNLHETKEEFKIAQQLAKGFPTLLLSKNNQKQIVTSGYFNLKEMTNFLDSL